MELTSIKIIQRRREVDEVQMAGSLHGEFGIRGVSQRGGTSGSGRKVGMCTERVKCALSSRLSCGDCDYS